MSRRAANRWRIVASICQARPGAPDAMGRSTQEAPACYTDDVQGCAGVVTVSTVLVTGGSGTLGSLVVPLLKERGDDVRVLSRRPGRGTHTGDLRTRAGLEDAIGGVDVVIHAASDTRRLGSADLLQTQNLLRSLGDVRHLLYVSIVGIDRVPYRYYRRKLDCEHAIEAAGVPHTIVRATQFHQLLEMVLRVAERLPVAPLPLDFPFQPVAAADCAARVATLAEGEPLGRAPDMGGPEVLSLAQIGETWREQRRRPRRFARLPLRGRVASAFRAGLHTCPDRAEGRQRWSEYVATEVR